MGVLGEAGDAVEKAAKVLKGNAHGERAIDFAAQSAEIVTRTLRNVLLPFAALNFGIEKAKVYFEQKFGPELEAKLRDVPADSIVEPRAGIAGPVVQGLAYSFEDDSIRNLYLNLLRTAMDGREPDRAHPAFVEIIKQLSPRDARLLSGIRHPKKTRAWAYPIVRVVAVTKDGTGSVAAYSHVLDAGAYFPEENFAETSELAAAAENWIRLGLFTANYSTSLMSDGVYAFEDGIPGLEGMRDTVAASGDKELKFERGVLRLTDFGFSFLEAVVDGAA